MFPVLQASLLLALVAVSPVLSQPTNTGHSSSPLVEATSDTATGQLIQFISAHSTKLANVVSSRNVSASDHSWELKLLKRLQKEMGIYGRKLFYDDLEYEDINGELYSTSVEMHIGIHVTYVRYPLFQTILNV